MTLFVLPARDGTVLRVVVKSPLRPALGRVWYRAEILSPADMTPGQLADQYAWPPVVAAAEGPELALTVHAATELDDRRRRPWVYSQMVTVRELRHRELGDGCRHVVGECPMCGSCLGCGALT